jgi:hypothetical protein
MLGFVVVVVVDVVVVCSKGVDTSASVGGNELKEIKETKIPLVPSTAEHHDAAPPRMRGIHWESGFVQPWRMKIELATVVVVAQSRLSGVVSSGNGYSPTNHRTM